MPKFSPKHGNEWDGKDWGDGRKPKNWGVETPVVDENGRLVHNKDGSVMKKKVCMQDGKFADGLPQSLYYPEGHKCTGVFKGMAVILEEGVTKLHSNFRLSVQSSSVRRARLDAVAGDCFTMSPTL